MDYMNMDKNSCENESSLINFSYPDQLGVHVSLCGDKYELIDGDDRITDGFLDFLIENHKAPMYPLQYEFRGREGYADAVTIDFHEDHLVVNEKVYNISFLQFFNCFIENIKKFSLYYASPCNYRAFFCASYDEMISKFEKYRPKEKELLDKLNGCLKSC